MFIQFDVQEYYWFLAKSADLVGTMLQKKQTNNKKKNNNPQFYIHLLI